MNVGLPKEIKSLWISTTASTNYPQLREDIETDVAIVGGGIAGINAAYFLKNKGLKVVLIDSSNIITGTSGNTTSKVTSQHNLKYAFLKKHFGNEKAKMYADSNQWAISELEKIIDKEKIECDFHRLPAYVYTWSEEGLEKINEEVKAAKELGLPASFVSSVDSIPFKIEGAVKFENQAYFHPRKFLLALAKKVNRDGSYIFESTTAKTIEEEDNFCKVITDEGNIKAKHVIVATDFPFYDKGFFFARLYEVRSYVLALKIKGQMPEGMFINTIDENIFSFRPHKSGNEQWLFVGGADHKAGEEGDVDHFAKLEEQAKKRFNIKSIDYKWAAQDCNTFDRVPYIGRMPRTKNIFVTTGFGEWGMTTSFVSAKLLSDLVTNEKNKWEELYDPSRISLVASAEGAIRQGENVVKGFLKHLVEKEDIKSLKPNEGKVIKYKGKKVAVYKDEKGNIQAVSAVCTHMGCIVGWNNGEKTWDCPCHGSRYDKYGKVINGPARKELHKVDINSI